MSLDGNRYDVVVIGGGFAGCTAARDLTEQGKNVLLLEAQDRLGGRCYSTKFPGTDLDIELGGEYIALPGYVPGPGNVLVAAELERYGIETATVPLPEAYPTIFNNTRHPGPFPIPLEQVPYLEQAALRCVKAAMRIELGTPLDQQGLEDLDIPLSEFLAPLELPPETYDFVTTVFGFYYVRFPEEISALHALAFLAMWDLSVVQLYAGGDMHIPTGLLLQRMTAEVTEVRLGTPVVRVDQTGDDVLVTTAAGETVSASAVVVATPINIWNDIEFVPQLSEEKRVTSAERHQTDRGVKIMLRVRNMPRNEFVIGAPRSTGGPTMVHGDRDLDNGEKLLVMFAAASVEGDEDYHFDPGDRACIERALETMAPGAELIDFVHHNYQTDPYAKGDPIAWKPGRLTKSHAAVAAAEGRLSFATADIAHHWICAIEGAVETGHRAAREMLNHLGHERETAGVGER